MSHPKLYPAVQDETAPFGWRSECGMFFRPDWKDELVEIDGKPHISVTQVLCYEEPGDRTDPQPARVTAIL